MKTMRTTQHHQAALDRRAAAKRRAQAGFTLAEVLLSIVVFTISIVGVVAVQRATLGSQENAMQMRWAQRIAQMETEQFKGAGFNEYITWDFGGSPGPSFPYDDLGATRMAAYRFAPVDINWSAPTTTDPIPPGIRRDHYRIVRRMSSLPAGAAPAGDTTQVEALQFDVWVLWIDHNPAFPPPATASAATLIPENMDPSDGLFLPWARGVHMSTVRANDGDRTPAVAGTAGTGAP